MADPLVTTTSPKALHQLNSSIRRSNSSSSASENDGEVEWGDSRNGGQHLDEADMVVYRKTDEEHTEHKKSKGRYHQSLQHMKPLRPFAGDQASKVDRAGLLSYITYWWVFGYLWSAFRGLIPREDQWSVSHFDSTKVNLDRLEILWAQEVHNPNRRGPPKLWRAVFRFFKTRFYLSSLIFAFCLAFGFIGPTCLVRALVHYVEVDAKRQAHMRPINGEMEPDREIENENLTYGLMLVGSLLLVEIARVLSYGASWAISYRSGIRVRSAVLALLYKKLMKLRSLRGKTVGEIVNIYANDGQRIFDAVCFAPLVVTGPFVLIGGIVYLLYLIGPWSLLGLGIYLLFDIFQIFLGITMVRYRKKAVTATEQRVGLMSEILACMRLIKMNAMENAFMDKIQILRDAETSALRTAGYAQSLAIATGTCVPVIATIITFLALISAGNDLSASQAFSAITVYFVMMFGIRMIPYGMRYVAEAMVSLRNINALLLLPDIDVKRGPPIDKSFLVQIKDASFAWETEENDEPSKSESLPLSPAAATTTSLSKIDLNLTRRQLIGVCGGVGSGKSALIQGVLGRMVQRDGTALIAGTQSYAAQQPWIINATFRENVLFGEKFEEQRYYRVLYVCALNHDVNGMSAQDMTEIGERGVTLSGGQKARLSLARALYAKRDLYLLDDVTSSLDNTVADHVFRYAIKGLLAEKAVIAVVNNAKYLSQCDRVVFMGNGTIVDQGTHDELIRRCDEYRTFVETHAKPHRDTRSIDTVLNPIGSVDDSIQTRKMSGGSSFLNKRRGSKSSQESTTMVATDSLFDIPEAVNMDGGCVEDEEMLGLGGVSFSVYWSYVKSAGGIWAVMVVLLSFLANVGTTVFASVWLSEWLDEGHKVNITIVNETVHIVHHINLSESPNSPFFASVYAATVCVLFLTSVFKAIVFVKISLGAACRLHNRMFHKLMHSVMRFHDTTPSGRVLNRFSKDVDEIDVKLPFSVESFVQNLFMCTGYITMIAVVFPWFLVACLPIGVMFFVLVACFRAGIRNLKRMENNSRSPLFEHISTSLDGSATIAAFKQTKRFNNLFAKYMDDNAGAMFMFHSTMRWLAVWLDVLVVLITTIVSLFMVLYADTVQPAYAGMALTFAIQMSGIFQFAVRMHTETEAKMTSVERVQHYITTIDQEPDWYFGDVTPPIDWPSEGRVTFKNVKLRYRQMLPLALNDVSFEILPKDKIGIVGRTGSGKTSLAQALFRIYPVAEGSIEVDGVDITKIGLHELRSKIETIPQDPQLFSGSVRFNLDPNRQHTDAQLWEALERTQMKEKIVSLGEGLDASLTEGGNNLSSGERQLLCMTRALIRDVRVLLLDEATSSLDAHTDALIQRCLTDVFTNCTLIIIAHRLHSLMNVDKILYMDGGKCVEYGRRSTLLEDKKSRFSQLVAKAESQMDVPLREDSFDGEATPQRHGDSD